MEVTNPNPSLLSVCAGDWQYANNGLSGLCKLVFCDAMGAGASSHTPDLIVNIYGKNSGTPLSHYATKFC